MNEQTIVASLLVGLLAYILVVYKVGHDEFNSACVVFPCLSAERGLYGGASAWPHVTPNVGSIEVTHGQQEASSNPLVPGNGPIHHLKVIRVYKHDPEAYTQGLIYLGNDTLFESTGSVGRHHKRTLSSLRRVDLETGEVKKIKHNKYGDFGEGLAYYKGYLWQLIWRTRKVYQYDPKTFQVLSETTMPQDFQYMDGWGLTSSSDGLSDFYGANAAPPNEELYVTDSGTKLYKVEFDGKKFVQKSVTTVTSLQGIPVEMPNELELIGGEVWANIYTKDCIARINPSNGKVLGWILGDEISRKEQRAGGEVFNGIAYDHQNGRLWVTGKLWAHLFEVQLVESSGMSVQAAERMCVPTYNTFHPKIKHKVP